MGAGLSGLGSPGSLVSSNLSALTAGGIGHENMSSIGGASAFVTISPDGMALASGAQATSLVAPPNGVHGMSALDLSMAVFLFYMLVVKAALEQQYRA